MKRICDDELYLFIILYDVRVSEVVWIKLYECRLYKRLLSVNPLMHMQLLYIVPGLELEGTLINCSLL